MPNQENGATNYVSPYSIVLQNTEASLSANLDLSIANESDTPQSNWYDVQAIVAGGGTTVWGPEQSVTMPPPIPEQVYNQDVKNWMRERVIYVAEQYIGINYAHQHIPSWLPPSEIQWWVSANPHLTPVEEASFQAGTGYGKGLGLDCTDFSKWYYNKGLGILLNSDTQEQSDPFTAAQGIPHFPQYGNNPDDRVEVNIAFPTPDLLNKSYTNAELIAALGAASDTAISSVLNSHALTLYENRHTDTSPGSWYNLLRAALLPADVLYIKGGPASGITHAIMWLGDKATQQGGSVFPPLIIDAHGGVYDTNGVLVPTGVYIRPFYQIYDNNNASPSDWYFGCFAYALRYIN